MDEKYSVYVKADESGYVVAVNSDEFLRDVTGWTKIDEGCGDKYHHAQGNYFEKPIVSDSGAYRYKLENGVVRELTDDELVEPEQEPTPQEDMDAMLIDHEYRLTLLELGLSEY